ncbi:MAG: NUDIX domain-containing protein [Rhodospirillales bacterium]
MTSATARPRDAAGLILLRHGPEGREILMGRRRRSARFLPGIPVFPGGGLERGDHRASGYAEALAPAPRGLDGATRRALPGLLRCALRETWEETGVLLGRPARAQPAHPEDQPLWQAYRAQGLEPALERPRLLARAITPRRSPIRFHTRFFLAEVTTNEAHGQPRDGELEFVAWIPVEEARAMDLIDVTRFMLELALDRGARDRAPLLCYQQDATFIVEDGARRRVTEDLGSTGLEPSSPG